MITELKTTLKVLLGIISAMLTLAIATFFLIGLPWIAGVLLLILWFIVEFDDDTLCYILFTVWMLIRISIIALRIILL